MSGWCHSPSAVAFRELHARGPCPHVHTSHNANSPGYTTPGGCCRELPTPSRSGRDPGTLSGAGTVQLSHAPSLESLSNPLSFAVLTCPLHWAGVWELPTPTRSGRDSGTLSGAGTVQLSHAWPCPRFAGPPNPLSFAVLMCPLHWADAWELPDGVTPPQGILLPPYRAGAHSSALPSIPRSWGVGTAQPGGLQQATRSGGQVFWPGTKVTGREVTAQQCLLSHFNMKKFPTIIRAGRSCTHFPGQSLEEGPEVLLGQCLACPQEGGLS